jgi:hypothetical protein
MNKKPIVLSLAALTVAGVIYLLNGPNLVSHVDGTHSLVCRSRNSR